MGLLCYARHTVNTKSLSQKRSLPALLAMRPLDNTWRVEGEQIRASWLATRVNPFAPEPPVTARADPRPFYPL